MALSAGVLLPAEWPRTRPAVGLACGHAYKAHRLRNVGVRQLLGLNDPA